jgi:hypothetical protein
MFARVWMVVFVMSGGWAAAAAQDVDPQPASAPLEGPRRTDRVQQQRAEKVRNLVPYQQNRFEGFLLQVEERYLVQRLFDPPRGVFMRFGGFPEGGGIAAGPAVRYSNHTMSLTASGAISVQRYWELDTRLTFPRLAGGKAFAEVGGRYRDLPREDFYGLGRDSTQAMRTSYAMRETSVDAVAGVTPVAWLTVAASVEHLSPRLGTGRDPRLPSTDQLFAEGTAPGLTRETDFARVGGRVAVDYTDKPLAPRAGGRYQFTFDKYTDRNLDAYSFNRWNVDLRQYIPIATTARSIALRAYMESATPDEGQEVPFYLQPTLGGGYSLRGLQPRRLRDRNLLLLQAEYRWDVNPFLTGALFYDAGQVAFSRSDFNLDEFNHDYGISVRFGWMKAVSLRTDLAFGSKEGTRLVFKFNDSF